MHRRYIQGTILYCNIARMIQLETKFVPKGRTEVPLELR